jgi:hypothetical protein
MSEVVGQGHITPKPVVASREEAELVIDAMKELITRVGFAMVQDLNVLVGFPLKFNDSKWGWHNLKEVKIRKVRKRDLYSIIFPPVEEI